jgi:hypothetical protein
VQLAVAVQQLLHRAAHRLVGARHRGIAALPVTLAALRDSAMPGVNFDSTISGR